MTPYLIDICKSGQDFGHNKDNFFQPFDGARLNNVPFMAAFLGRIGPNSFFSIVKDSDSNRRLVKMHENVL